MTIMLWLLFDLYLFTPDFYISYGMLSDTRITCDISVSQFKINNLKKVAYVKYFFIKIVNAEKFL